MDTPLNRIWKDKPELIRGYFDKIATFQRLCDEVKYIIDHRVNSSSIEIGMLSSRAKTLESFCEKIERKSYNNPFNEITDFAGVRIVFLYSSDRIKLEALVEEEFEIIEKVDKIADQGVEKFGYGALHYIVRLKQQHAGARYDDLRQVFCEIQIRTILQDAWAVVAHHLSYKHEDDIPPELKRKLHALSGLFETADDQFERINHLRIEYQGKVKDSIELNMNNLDAEINLDNLLGYLSWKFSDRERVSKETAADLLEELNEFGYTNLLKLDELVDRAKDAVYACELKYPPTDHEDGEPTRYVSVGVVRIALEFINEDYRRTRDDGYFMEKRNEFLPLLKQ